MIDPPPAWPIPGNPTQTQNWKFIFLKLLNSARKSIKIFWAQTFSTQSLPGPNFFKPSVPGDLRVFRAFASLFLWGWWRQANFFNAKIFESACHSKWSLTLYRSFKNVEHKKRQKQEIQTEEVERETGPSLPTKVLRLFVFRIFCQFQLHDFSSDSDSDQEELPHSQQHLKERQVPRRWIVATDILFIQPLFFTHFSLVSLVRWKVWHQR